jgi:hypothetical protein
MSEQRRTPKPTPSKTDDIGHGYWDEKLLAEQIEELTSKVCPGCGKSCGVTLSGNKKSGAGGELVFMCKLCYEVRPLQRGSKLAKAPGEAGAAAEANTLRMVNAFQSAGIGLAEANSFLHALDMSVLNTRTWQVAADKSGEGAEEVLAEEIEKNIQAEIAATLREEGESARGADGKIKIGVMTDGSWQKRYGRNSLWGYGVMYGQYTGKVVFVKHRCARCTTCASAHHRGVEVPKHECTRNWDERSPEQGAAGNMEKHIALEGVEFLFKRGAIVHALICDGDTKTAQFIKERGPPEVAAVITTRLDLNHVQKNLGKQLRECKSFTEQESAALQNAFASAVYYAREASAAAALTEGDLRVSSRTRARVTSRRSLCAWSTRILTTNDRLRRGR